VFIPEPARGPERPMADVVTLFRPSEVSVAPPLRLTRRGVAALAGLVAVVAVLIVGLAWASAPGSAPRVAPPPATVTVSAGDTLWSIASRVAPASDPGDEVARLVRLNSLSGVDLAAGQVLRTR